MMFGSSICRFVLLFAILLYVNICCFANAEKISDKRLCGDRSCQTLISKARTLARHKPTDPAFLPFERGVMIDIYSKSAGSRKDLWGGEVNGRKGYFPRSFVREYKVENPSPQFEVDTEHHVPLEERLRSNPDRRQVPQQNARTVKQESRQQDTPQQPQTEPVQGHKEEKSEEKNEQATSEPVDETEIDDETELADDEQETENIETGSSGGKDPASGRETDSPKTETLEEEKPADVDKQDPTEVDETEIAEDETEPEPEENKDETETDETEFAEEEELAAEKEDEEIKEDKHKDDHIDKPPEDTSTDIVEEEKEDEINLDKIKETLITQEAVKKEQGDEPNEREEHVDEAGDKKERGTETAADETGNAEGEGSMFGSIWSDDSEGKIADNEGIDINHLSHGEHAVNIPNPDINTGDDIDTFKNENIKSGDGTMHENVNNGDDISLESDDSEMHEDRNDRETEVNKGMNKTESGAASAMEIEHKNKDLDESKNVDDIDKAIDTPLSEYVDADKEKVFLDSVTKLTQNDPHDTEKFVNDIENGNVHLKDILKSSLPDGNNVHQYIVEHAVSDNQIPTSDPLDTDLFSTEMNHDKLDKSKDDLINHKETEGKVWDTDEVKDDKVIDDSHGLSKNEEKFIDVDKKSDNHEETVLSHNTDKSKVRMESQLNNAQERKDEVLRNTEKDKITKIKEADKMTENREASTDANQKFVDSNVEGGNPETDAKTNITDILTNKTNPDKDIESFEDPDARDIEIIKESTQDLKNSDDSDAKENERISIEKETAFGDQSMDNYQTHEIKNNALSPEMDVIQNTRKQNGEEKVDAQLNFELKPDKHIENSDQADDSALESKDKVLNNLYNNGNGKDKNLIDGSRKSMKNVADETGIGMKNVADEAGTGIKNNSKSLKDDTLQHNESTYLEEGSNGAKLTAEKTDADIQELDTVEVTADGRTTYKLTRDPEDSRSKKTVDILRQADIEEKKAAVDEDKRNFVDVTKDTQDEAVMSPFQKKDGETEGKENQDLPANPSNDQNKDKDVHVDDTRHGVSVDSEKQSGEGNDVDQNVSDNQMNIERNEETVKLNKDDEDAEKIIDNFEKVVEAMADVKEEVKDVTSEGIENGKDDLKFINDKGEVISEGVDRQKDKHEDELKEQIDSSDSGVKEIEQIDKETNIHGDKRPHSVNVDEELTKDQKVINEQDLSKFEELASGMMSILATPTLNEPNTDTSSSVPESTRPVDVVTEARDRAEGTLLTGTEAQISETESTVESVTKTMQETVSEQVDTSVIDQQMTVQTSGSAVQGTDTIEPVQDETKGGGVVIDGTTFDADYFGDDVTSDNIEATEQIISSTSVVDNRLYTPSGNVKPTKLFDIPVKAEQTLLPTGMQQDIINAQDFKTEKDQQAQTNAPDYIQASETVTERPAGQENMPSDKVSVLGTSFNAVTSKVEEAHTQPIKSIGVDFETLPIENNETVVSDIVQDLVQPSLDQNAYNTDVFISRKPLSTEPASAKTSVETDVHGQETTTEGEPAVQGQAETKPEIDENNNEVTEKIVEEVPKNQGEWTQFAPEGSLDDSTTLPTTETPEQIDPYIEHLLSRKVPDPELDEELKQPDDNFMKILEPYLKSLINMLPPSLQTVLEQEPLGLSPTITMLVSMISTNVVALLTCMGCMCKSKKKQPGRKDPLVVIRDLEEKLFIATKEKENLEDDLQIKNKKVAEMQEELNSQQSTTGTVETDLKTIKLYNESLKKQLSEVQTELEDYRREVTEKSQIVVYKDSELQNYQAEVQSLTQRAQDAELGLQKTSQGLGEKEEELRLSLQQIQSLSEQIQQLETSKQQLQDEAVLWSEKVKDLTEQVEQFSSESKRMQEDLAFKENELEVLRDCFLQVKAFQGEDEMKEETEESPDLGEKLKQMMDVSRVNASLRSVEEERDVIQNKLLIEVESRKELEDQVQLLKRKFESNQTDKMKAERQCQEAQTKLEVLSKYFREKEAELTRQLGEQEVLKNQNISKLQSSDSITQELSKENDSYRQQIEELKTEISKAERDFRSQIAANEKKAHENWLATRAAERELKESRHECGMLRQKLTDLERKLMQGPPPGVIRPITHRAMPPPGMLNGPPPPPPERPGSRGSVHGHVTPRLRDDDYRASPIGPDRMPPPPDRRLPPGPMGPRPPPPPLDAMSPPPYAIRPPFPPDRRSPLSFDRYPPPRGPRPPYPRPPPPHLRSPPPMGSNPPEHDDSKQGWSKISEDIEMKMLQFVSHTDMWYRYPYM
ncbi:transport and Golgi organization protein 1 homolog isoform X2 [Mercenaria mercenaria]|uniref:transport and Golgi organization protein 1 homolog isoform X2 n=1 Tax=Mercenaria mercenaria TaxID=6596 RepID=UPI00234E773C|nr:transport and Golgi organization protein 1 homolog isoform X2 [Mercenaria mercenaria]